MIKNQFFYFKRGFFEAKEEFASFVDIFSGFLKLPLVVIFLAWIWDQINKSSGTLSFQELIIYIGITESIQFNLFASGFLAQAGEDYSIGMVRPRSWLGLKFAGAYARTLARSLQYITGGFLFLILWNHFDIYYIFSVYLRILLVLPLVTFLLALVTTSLVFIGTIIIDLRGIRFLLGKLTLTLGGVFGPLCDVGEPAQSFFLKMPFGDIIFQPAYFALKGSFYHMSVSYWLFLMFFYIILMFLTLKIIEKKVRQYHQGIGG